MNNSSHSYAYKRNRKKTLRFAHLMLLFSMVIWCSRMLDMGLFFTGINAFPILEIIMTYTTLMVYLTHAKKTRLINLLSYVLIIPAIPFLLVGILSQSKPFATLTLPLATLPIVGIISTLFYNSLTLLNLGHNFNTKIIPYLNLTTITILFAYFDKPLVKITDKLLPKEGMPDIVREWTWELLDKKIFLKLAYLLVTILMVATTIEKLNGTEFLPLPFYKNIVLESLLTFVALDRLFTKFKKT